MYAGLVSLKIFSASFNPLQRFNSTALDGSTKLGLLSLAGCQLQTVPDLSNLSTSLEALHLQRNFISSIEPGWISKLTNLEELNLSFNNLMSFPFVTLVALESLTVLNLTENNLTTLYDVPGLALSATVRTLVCFLHFWHCSPSFSRHKFRFRIRFSHSRLT